VGTQTHSPSIHPFFIPAFPPLCLSQARLDKTETIV
jgi:hypothetical protein